MGGTSQTTQATSSTTQPWEKVMPQINSLLGEITPNIGGTGSLTGNEQKALTGLTANAQAGNPYATGIGNVATDLLAGGPDRTGIATDAYNTYKSQISPYTTMDTNPYSNQAFQNFTNTLTQDISDRIKSQYAGAGYSPVSSGDYAKQLGEGISRGVAPTYLQAYNDLTGQKLGAINSLYNAGGSTAGLLSGLDTQSLQNRAQGINAAQSALDARDYSNNQLLNVEALRRGIPLQNISQAESLVLPIAQLGSTTQGQSMGTYTMSPAQQAWGWMNAFGSPNPFKFTMPVGGK